MNKYSKSITAALLGFSLAGCLPAIFVAGAAVGGAVIYDKRNLKTIGIDSNIAQYLRREINKDPNFKDSEIDVTAFNKILLLVGQVSSSDLKETVNKMAMSVPNVRRVYNEIQVRKKMSYAQAAKDSCITTLVKAALLGAKGLRSSQIKVLTEDSVVYLMGIVTPQQSKIASDAASTVSGVKQVVKVFELVK
jgi:osmotically-inducible protein OsmY